MDDNHRGAVALGNGKLIETEIQAFKHIYIRFQMHQTAFIVLIITCAKRVYSLLYGIGRGNGQKAQTPGIDTQNRRFFFAYEGNGLKERAITAYTQKKIGFKKLASVAKSVFANPLDTCLMQEAMK